MCQKDGIYRQKETEEKDEKCELDLPDENIEFGNLIGTLDYNSENSNINEWCSSLFFYNINIGYATTQSGEIYKTRDGGKNWKL